MLQEIFKRADSVDIPLFLEVGQEDVSNQDGGVSLCCRCMVTHLIPVAS